MNTIYHTFKLTIGRAIGYTVVFLAFLTMSAVALTVMTFFTSASQASSIESQFAINNMASIITYTSIVIYFYSHRAMRFSYRIHRVSSLIHVALMASMMGIAISVAFNTLFQYMPYVATETELLARLGDGAIHFYILALIIAPVFEEILFRGIILRGLLNQYAPNKAVISSALMFGAFHLTLSQFVSATLMGIVFGWVYYRTRSLLYVSLMHVVANAMILLSNTYLIPILDSDFVALSLTTLLCVAVYWGTKKWLHRTATVSFDGRPHYMYSDLDKLQVFYDDIDLH